MAIFSTVVTILISSKYDHACGPYVFRYIRFGRKKLGSYLALNLRMKTNSLLLLALCLLATHIPTLATATTKALSQPTASTFSRLRAVKLKELGKQCLYTTAEQYSAAAEKQTDPELKLSAADFDRSIAFLGESIENYTPLYDLSLIEKSELCFMTQNEITALMMYSMSAYRKLNVALRDQDSAMLEQFRIYIKTLNSALDKIRNYEGFVKRGAGTNRARFDDHQVGAVVTYPSYTSTSIGHGFGGVARYVIYSKTCKYIAPFSVASAEEEVLCKPGTKFKIVYREDKKTLTHLMMEEVLE